jgi:methylphosphotriester-DNA--protein-cysteine methyltransferase
MIESYFRNGHTFHIFRESYRSRPKVRTQENIDTVQRLGQLLQQTELTVSTCQRIVRKDLEDSVTAERYWNNILDVFINQLQLAQGYFQQDGATARGTSLFVVIF